MTPALSCGAKLWASPPSPLRVVLVGSDLCSPEWVRNGIQEAVGGEREVDVVVVKGSIGRNAACLDPALLESADVVVVGGTTIGTMDDVPGFEDLVRVVHAAAPDALTLVLHGFQWCSAVGGEKGCSDLDRDILPSLFASSLGPHYSSQDLLNIEDEINTLARFYHIPVLSVRNALFTPILNNQIEASLGLSAHQLLAFDPTLGSCVGLHPQHGLSFLSSLWAAYWLDVRATMDMRAELQALWDPEVYARMAQTPMTSPWAAPPLHSWLQAESPTWTESGICIPPPATTTPTATTELAFELPAAAYSESTAVEIRVFYHIHPPTTTPPTARVPVTCSGACLCSDTFIDPRSKVTGFPVREYVGVVHAEVGKAGVCTVAVTSPLALQGGSLHILPDSDE